MSVPIELARPQGTTVFLAGGGEMPGEEKAHVAEKLGAAVTLPKPVSGETLLNSVQALLGR